MQIITITVTDFEQNARLLIDQSTRSAAVVDPGGGVEEIVGAVQDEGAKVELILLTHAHLDHAGGVKKIISLLTDLQGKPPQFYAHKDEQFMRASLSGQARMFGLSSFEFEDCPEPDHYLKDEEEFWVGQTKIKTLFTPGHSPGHLAFYINETKPILLSGDALFKGSIGRTDLPGGNHRLLIKSIEEKLLSLPDHTLVMSGHGADSTIFNEKHKNPFLVSGEKV